MKSLRIFAVGLLMAFITSIVFIGSPFALAKSHGPQNGQEGKVHIKKENKMDEGKDDEGSKNEDNKNEDSKNEDSKSDANKSEGNKNQDIKKDNGNKNLKNQKKVSKNVKKVRITGVVLNKTCTTIPVGSWERLVAFLQPANAKGRVLWCSGDPTVAAVNPSGKVTGISPGQVTIYAVVLDGFKTASCQVTVTAGNTTVSRPVTGISLNKTSTTVEAGQRETLVATVQPADATDKTVIWFSARPDVATVDKNGTVTGKSTGSTLIFAISRDGLQVASCLVNVGVTAIDIHVTGVSLDHASTELLEGSTDRLVATVYPANATNKAVQWSSSDPTIVRVDQNGNITGLREGAAYLTVLTVDGSKTATCTVIVKKPVTEIAVTSVTINRTTPYIALRVGGVKSLTAAVLPANATNKNFTWSSGNTAIATVDQAGNVTGIASGTATITVVTASGAKSDSCSVRVFSAAEWQAVTGVHLNLINTTIPAGFVDNLKAYVEPGSASELEVRWSSSNNAVAAVSIDGKVEAKAEGTAIITATTVDGSKTAACYVTVIPALAKPADGILINKIASTIAVGQTDYAQVLVYPTGSAVPAVTWKTSNSTVAAVNQSGEVTGVRTGTAVITAETSSRGAASYIITVN